MLGQQAMVLHKGWDLWRSLGLIVHCAVDLHVPVKNLQETFLTLWGVGGQGGRGEVKIGKCTRKESQKRNHKEVLSLCTELYF